MGLSVAIPSKTWVNRLDALALVLNRIAPPQRWAARETVLRAVDRVSKKFSADITAIGKDADLIFGDTGGVVDLVNRWHKEDAPSLAALCVYAMEKWDLDIPENLTTGVLTACVLGEVDNPLPYHNNLHFKKVLLQLLRLIEANGGFSANDIALMLMAACVHDLGHDGDTAEAGRLERRSFDIARVYLEELGFNDARGLESIRVMLICTDVGSGMNEMKAAYRFHFMGEERKALREDLAALENNPDLALMALTLHEADVATSAGLDYALTKYETTLYKREKGEAARPEHIVDFLDTVCQREMLSEAARKLYQDNMRAILMKAKEDADLGGVL